MNKDEMLVQLNSWFEEFIPFTEKKENVKSRFLISPLNKDHEQNAGYKCQFFTRNYEYVIIARESKYRKEGSLSGGVNNRLPRAGEDWNRGNDLSDGNFSQKTWDKIKNDIMFYEIVKISKIVLDEHLIFSKKT